MADAALVVWQLVDGKRGHERQSDGLIGALARRTALNCHRVAVLDTPFVYLSGWLRRRFAPGRDLPRPDLIIGAGRVCQPALLAARRAYGGRSIYLMRPGLWPPAWFDLCIIPRHDQPTPGAHVMVSEGPLNPMRPAPKSPTLALILIGGPSAHYDWDTPHLVAQIERLIAADPDRQWVISDSRRTPPGFAAAVNARPLLAARYRAFADCAPDWLESTLARAAQAWVSADSVAMIYEALSAGARVGILDVPAKSPDRINTITTALLERGWVMRADVPSPTTGLTQALDEAGRCADRLFERWPELHRRES